MKRHASRWPPGKHGEAAQLKVEPPRPFFINRPGNRRRLMKTNHATKLLIVLSILIAMPVMTSAQRRRPRLPRAPPRPTTPVVPPLVPVATNLKIRLNDTLSSRESRAGDRFAATVIDPLRLSEPIWHGHMRS